MHSEDHIQIEAQMVTNRAIEISCIGTCTPLPIFRGLNTSDLGSRLRNNRGVSNIVSLHAVEEKLSVVVCNSLLGSTCNSIMMLVYS